MARSIGARMGRCRKRRPQPAYRLGRLCRLTPARYRRSTFRLPALPSHARDTHAAGLGRAAAVALRGIPGRHARPGISAWSVGIDTSRSNLRHALVVPRQLTQLASVARGNPELQIVINHLGTPLRETIEDIAQWTKGMRDCAKCANMSIKLSGIPGSRSWVGARTHRRSRPDGRRLVRIRTGACGPPIIRWRN